MYLNSCPVCDSNKVEFQETLKKYPIGNVYLNSNDMEQEYLRDFSLFQCSCGHLMGESVVPPNVFYSENYPYLGEANTVKLRHQEGVNFVLDLIPNLSFNNVVDIGCAGMNLLRTFKLFPNNVQGEFVGIDPVPLRETKEGIRFINGFFDPSQFELKKHIDQPNLILLDNVLEHIRDLNDFFTKLVRWINKGDLVYVCVPSLELMVAEMRFEEISHEHVHYFSKLSLERLLSNFGFRSLKQATQKIASRGYNFLLFRFDGNPRVQISTNQICEFPIGYAFESFRSKLRNLKFLENVDYWGAGASELTPSVSYFMENRMNFLQGIFDTTEIKFGKYMPGVTPQITPWHTLDHVPKSAVFFITVENLREFIVPNLRKHGFHRFH